MSSRDIDTTSENVLHDWAREEGADDAESRPSTPSSVERGGARRRERRSDRGRGSGLGHGVRARTAPSTKRRWQPSRRRPTSEVVDESSKSSVADDAEVEEGEVEIDETPMHVELSQEHAAGDLHIPDGYAVLEGVAEGGRRAVGVVVSRFNGHVTSQLLDGALAELSAAGVPQEAITIMVVPGAFELPLAATALAKTRRFACIVALGCVIRGDTPHFDYVSSEAASGLQLAALETGVPVSFGVLTLDRVEQAEARVGKGAEAVRSALEMADLFAHLRAAAAR